MASQLESKMIGAFVGGLTGLFMASLGYNFTTPEFWVAILFTSFLAAAVAK